jgi:pre-mRNA cleavage complex 2 protein Pcf11
MAEHMDWHFQMHKRESRRASLAVSQQWWMERDEWASYRDTVVEDAPAVEQAGGGDGDGGGGGGGGGGDEAADLSRRVIIAADDDQTACPICGDEFDKFFDDDSEEWMYAGAFRLEAYDEQQAALQETAASETPEQRNERLSVEAQHVGYVIHAVCYKQQTGGLVGVPIAAGK